MRILVLQNCPLESAGAYVDHLRARGADVDVRHPYRGARLPPRSRYDAVIVGGTPVSARTPVKDPLLRRLLRMLRATVAEGRPCLGICCGGQLLARALGGGVTRCPRMEIGGYSIDLTPAGRDDPLFRGFPIRFPAFLWHGDTFTPPPGARSLAATPDCPAQAFRRGSAVGVIFHLETDPAEAGRWASAYADDLGRVGKTQAAVVAACRRRAPRMRRLAARLVDNWIGLWT